MAATQRLFVAQQTLPRHEDTKMPYIIGVGGSVAVGKSTTARVLQALLTRWPNRPQGRSRHHRRLPLAQRHPGTRRPDGEEGLSGELRSAGLLRFLSDVKAGNRPARAPIYSHLVYDVMPNKWVEIDQPDILIVEGLNVLQAGRLPKDGAAIPFVSDFFDFSIYLDADEEVLRQWYVDRFITLRSTSFRDPMSYFHRYARLSDAEAVETATSIWTRINLVNLRENILPTRQRADLSSTRAPTTWSSAWRCEGCERSPSLLRPRSTIQPHPEEAPLAWAVSKDGGKRGRAAISLPTGMPRLWPSSRRVYRCQGDMRRTLLRMRRNG